MPSIFFTGYRVPAWQGFSFLLFHFSTLKVSLHCLLTSVISVENQPSVSVVCGAFRITFVSSLAAYDFFPFAFAFLKFDYDVAFFVLILL